MLILPKRHVNEKSLVYNERTDFTRRIPTFLTEKQLYRDGKIAARLIYLFDVEQDYEGMVKYFIEKSRLLSDPRYWELMRTVWIAAGSNATAPVFRALMKSKRHAKSWFMTPEDKAYFDSLPEKLTLYRAVDIHYQLGIDEYITDHDNIHDSVTSQVGDNKTRDYGLSWTLNHDWCLGYAMEHSLIVKSKVFNKSDCFAYISRRGEEEVIVL